MPTPQSHDREAHLTNRSAGLALFAALFFFVGLLTCGMTVEKTEDATLRAISGTPFAAALGSAAWARATRGKLHTLRRDGDATDSAADRPFASAVEESRTGAGAADPAPREHS